MSDKARFPMDAAPVVLRRALLERKGDNRKMAIMQMYISVHDPELRPMLPEAVQEAYQMMDVEKVLTKAILSLDYEDQTVQLAPYPTGSSEIRETGGRLRSFRLERKETEGNFTVRLHFALELEGDKRLGRWVWDRLGETVLLSARSSQPTLPTEEKESE